MDLIISKEKGEVRRLLNTLLKDNLFPTVSFLPDSFTLAMFSQEVETFPFLHQKKVVIVHEIDQLSDTSVNAIYAYVQKPSPWITLYLTAAELSQQNKIALLVEKVGKIHRIKEEKVWEKEKRLAQWLIEEAKQEKARLSMQAALSLVQGVEHDLLKIELDKLLCFISPRSEITLEDISLLTHRTPHETLWNLGDALFGYETGRALEIGAHLLHEEVAIFLLLANLRTQFFTAIEILNAVEAGEVGKHFPYLKGKILENKLYLLSRYGKERLQQGILLIFDAETKAKNSAIEPYLLLEILIIKLCAHDFISSSQFIGTYS